MINRQEMRDRHFLLHPSQQLQFVTILGLKAQIRAGWMLSYLVALLIVALIMDSKLGGIVSVR